MRIVLILLLVSLTDPAYAVKKCKDADGRWHYGDIAVADCEDSKITTLNERGFITEELPAPLSADEIQAEQEAATLRQAQEKQKFEADEEKHRILSIYETEKDIDRQRDNQLKAVQSNIDVHNAYLKGMDARIKRYKAQLNGAKSQNAKEKYLTQIQEAKARVEDSEVELSSLELQKLDIAAKFAREKELYLTLRNSE